MQRSCVCRSHFEPAQIWRNHGRLPLELSPQIFNQYRQRIEVIHRDIEEPLHLLRVQVHGEHTAHPGCMQQIGHQLGSNRDARLILAILARVSEKWNHRRYPIRAGAARRVHHNEQLHQMLIGRRTGRLNNEHIVPPNVFLNLYVRLAIGKRADRRLTERDADVSANALCKAAVGGAAENFQFWLEREHGAANLGAREWLWQSSKTCQQSFLSRIICVRGFSR